LSVERGDFQHFSFELRERPGKVELLVSPKVAIELLVDGEPVEVNAQSVAEIERGKHRLRVQSAWYLPVEMELDVIGLGQSQQIELVLMPAWAEVRILTRPEGVRVSHRGELLGITPLETRLLQGVQTLEFEKALFKPATLEVEVIAGESLILEDTVLQPADGVLVLESEPGAATVQVDGHYRGTTPASLSLSSGVEHRLQLSKPGFASWEKTLSLEPGQQQTLSAGLKPAYGTVFISVEPADARLRVDGKEQGNAMQRLRLTTRPHRLEIYKKGYQPRVFNVTPDAVNSRSINVTLKTTGQARQEATPGTMRTPAGQVLRLVRPGDSFTMGASRREAGRRSNESARLVRLVRPFYFGEKEVTNAEYRQYRSRHVTARADGASLNGDRQPVAGVSRDDAARYCNWLSRKQGYPEAYREVSGKMQLVTPVNTGYRLPSEAEWTYVARVLGRTENSRYPWSGKYPPSVVAGNFADQRISDTLAETVPGYDDQYRGSAPVGSFAPFPEGFYDLGGNVAEWMNDYYAVYPGESGKLVQEPFGPETGKHYVVRGSSWRHGNITELRLSYRDYSRVARSDIGFRLARYAH
jgi:formylglycine-generating enzyme required for sulfatase activity